MDKNQKLNEINCKITKFYNSHSAEDMRLNIYNLFLSLLILPLSERQILLLENELDYWSITAERYIHNRSNTSNQLNLALMFDSFKPYIFMSSLGD